MQLEIKKLGNSSGLILPKELMALLGLAQGDVVFASVGPGRTLQLTRSDPHHDTVMEIGREVFREYHETFKALAK